MSLLLALALQTVTAPYPDSLSAKAKHALEVSAQRPPEPKDIKGRRERAEAIQREIGQRRMARYQVRMHEATIGGVPVRVFLPKDGDKDDGTILLNLHGGGFLVDSGSITENVPIAALTGRRVIAVRYRLIPKHPFPAAVDDALAVYRTLLAERPDARIKLYGTSAGAILSAELIERLRTEKLRPPVALGFFSGSANLPQAGDSVTLFGAPGAVAALVKAYVGDTDPTSPSVSPSTSDLKDWPPTLCISSTRDFLLSATADFCRQLDAAGNDAKLIVYDGLPHAFWSYIDAPESDDAFAAMARFLNHHGDKSR